MWTVSSVSYQQVTWEFLPTRNLMDNCLRLIWPSLLSMTSTWPPTWPQSADPIDCVLKSPFWLYSIFLFTYTATHGHIFIICGTYYFPWKCSSATTKKVKSKRGMLWKDDEVKDLIQIWRTREFSKGCKAYN